MDSQQLQIKDFSYCLTSDLEDRQVRVKIGSLEGHLGFLSNENPSESLALNTWAGSSVLDDPAQDNTRTIDTGLCITCQVWADNRQLIPTTMQTSYKSHHKTRLSWNEWLVLPLKYRDLPVTAQLTITIWRIQSSKQTIPLAGTTFPLFGKHSTLRKGKHKLHVWPHQKADGQMPSSTPANVRDMSQMDQLEKLIRKYDRGDIEKEEWLDRLVFREIEKIYAKESLADQRAYLFIELVSFDFPVLFTEREYKHPPSVLFRRANTEVQSISDPEIFRENLVENKHRRLVRNHRAGPLDRDLKPNSRIRDELNKIVKYPPTQALTSEEKDLIWKFRFYLMSNRKSLTKFLKAVDWNDAFESNHAVTLLVDWEEIDTDDALELLGPTFTNASVRAYAVSRLQKADDEELRLYLLQLVQAVKFEPEIRVLEQQTGGKTNIPQSPATSASSTAGSSSSARREWKNFESALVDFLLERAIKNAVLGTYLYWYLSVEAADKTYGKMYAFIIFQLRTAMERLPDSASRRETLARQGAFVATLAKLSKELQQSREDRFQKLERLKLFVADPKNNLKSFPPLNLPLDPNIQVTGINVEKLALFKSALMPMRITFPCLNGHEYTVIFKVGDDLRQDQLVIQIITLMDRLLRKENLDLKLTPYKVMATGVNMGMLQFIPSAPLATILDTDKNIVNYLRKYHSDSSQPYGIDEKVMENYVRSCAGYCVITYLLGVGDRHLDNLLLTRDGRLFHIDFGYFLGRDPKPFPPPMKLCKEMVDAMGGANSAHYRRFKSFCYTTFNILRKNSNLIINLFSLMVNANISDIAIEPDKAVSKVQEKFRLDLNDEQAKAHFEELINASVSALFPQVMERIHYYAQYWRK